MLFSLFLLVVQIFLAARFHKSEAAFFICNRLLTVYSAFSLFYLQAVGLQSMLLLYNALLFLLVYQFSKQYFHGDLHKNHYFLGLTFLQLFSYLAISATGILALWLGFVGISVALYYLLSIGSAKRDTRLIRNHFIAGDIVLSVAFIGLVLPTVSGYFVAVFFILAVMIKSAIFPFNRWLEDSVIAASPLSAVMHAGIVNLGLLLLYNFYDLIFFNDGFTIAVVALLVMASFIANSLTLVQIDCKRRLIFSTSGQFAFMYLQAALGFFAGAFYHLMLHGLLKSNLFLSQTARYDFQEIKNKSSVCQDLSVIVVSLALATVLTSVTPLNFLISFFLSFTTVSFLQESYSFGGLSLLLILSPLLLAVIALYLLLLHAFQGIVADNLVAFEPVVSLGMVLVYSVCFIARQAIANTLLVNYQFMKLKWHLLTVNLFSKKTRPASVSAEEKVCQYD